MESEASVPVYRKCRPGGTLVMPWNLGEEVNETRSRPMKVLGGRETMRIVVASMTNEQA
jgi:hypothetical protein